jgi:hypothetical protein
LNLNTYKEEVFKDTIYEDPHLILDRLEFSEIDIIQSIKELKGLLL